MSSTSLSATARFFCTGDSRSPLQHSKSEFALPKGRSIRHLALALIVASAGLALGCAPQTQVIGQPFTAPALHSEALQTADGMLLPMRSWLPAGKPKAIVLALHGMNEYSNYFDMPAETWRNAGIAVYAYDQRGYGATSQIGIWPGAEVLAADFAVAVDLLRRRYPGTPLFAVGSSMGGGVVMVAMGKADPPKVDGIILEAPAVWSRSMMPSYQTALLWMASHTVPAMNMSGRGLRIVASDNREMLRERWRDPFVQKTARVDALWGVVDLMDRAYAAAPQIRVPTLLLYGANDQVVPRRPIEEVARLMPPTVQRVAYYENGWHMLFRDLRRVMVHKDVVAWIGDRTAPLPSGADRARLTPQLTRTPTPAAQ